MRPVVGDETAAGQDRVLQGRDVRVPAEDLRVLSDQLPVEVWIELVRVEAADLGQDRVDRRVGNALCSNEIGLLE